MTGLGSIAASALDALSMDTLVRAANNANINTQGFREQRVDFETAPGDRGVRIGAVYQSTPPGPMVPALIMTQENGRQVAVPGVLEGSNTDLAEQFVRMVGTERAFEANTAVIRTHDDMTGYLLDLKI